MKLIITTIIVLISLASFGQGLDQITITKQHDGDSGDMTIHTIYKIDILDKFRLLDLNAPEVTGISKNKGFQARDSLIAFCKGKIMTVEYIINRKGYIKRGKYGRILVTMYADTVNINNWLIKNGYAKHRIY